MRKGMEKGMEMGRQKLRQVALKMKSKGMPVQTIVEVTVLSEDTISTLK
jgi:hypothetical protein